MAAGPLVMLALARDNKVEEIERLVASGVPVDISNQTALHIAALWGNLEAAAALLRLGTPANIRNTSQRQAKLQRDVRAAAAAWRPH
ncbi:ANK_REP_REGION domain-containing protein [Haematococcus lacustris]|uniref:ANK_REP_REGION domain-containing protein n=1 Tax=Haematococcus lacustris TaxID=44745 RepID=A0A699ZQP0_HAELA|nr:ANK_REP_REGION domain-containing protein [Haematococcus lacustris]